MKETSPTLILVIIFILLGLAYTPLTNKRGDTTSWWKGESSIQSGNPNQDLSEKIKETQIEIKEIEKNIEKQIEESRRSRFYGKIRMSNISGLYGNNPSEQYFYLYTNLDKNDKINITGWYIKSEVTGYYAFIGKATLLPFPFSKNDNDIILKQGDTVIVTKGFSPIGISFRTNKCTGYFEENRTFYPSLSLSCPYIYKEKLPQFSNIQERNDECLDLIERIPRCKTVTGQYLRDLPDTVTKSCKEYMTTQVNYNSCIVKHFGDTDFPGNEYRVFLNRLSPLWKDRREKISLYDKEGFVVDSISY